jgi:hypothetical protein
MDEGVGPGRWQDDLYDLLRGQAVAVLLTQKLLGAKQF